MTSTNIQVLMLLLRQFGRLPARLWHQARASLGYQSRDAGTMSDAPVVELPSVARGAAVKGKVVHARGSNKPVYAYLGVPFAQPPVGELRFKPPKPLEPWAGIKDATKFGAGCPQPREMAEAGFPRFPLPAEMSEDCLYLNVYTPSYRKRDDKLPVMIWIHGGAFFLGSGDVYDGTALAAFHDIIVVTINYRLGIFGFLGTPDGALPGNQGFMDQVEAMRWVQKHIHSFGGNPGNVTLFGESAGSISISLHLVSPMTKGLFHKVICESGTSMYPGNIMTTEANAGFVNSNLKPLGLTSLAGQDVVKCLETQSTADLVQKFPKMFPKIIDGTYLTADPVQLYKNGHFHDVPLLCGFNSHEYLVHNIMFGSVMQQKDKEQASGFIDFTLKAMYFRGNPNAESISQQVIGHYLDDVTEGDSVEIEARCRDLHADCMFVAPTVHAARCHQRKNRVFLYEFCHRPHFSESPAGMGADHSEEIHYVFGEPFVTSHDWPAPDTKLSQLIMTYWTNFAKNGDPNGVGVPDWTRYDDTSRRYLRLSPSPVIARDVKPKQMALWNDVIFPLWSGSGNKSKL